MCAIRFLRLEDFLNPNNEISGMIVHLEPQGVLFADVRSFVHLSFSPSSSSSLDQIHQSLSQTSSEIKTTEEIIHQTQRSERKREREKERMNGCGCLGKNLPRPSHMRIDVTLWYRLITKGVITPNCYDGNSTISSSLPTSPSTHEEMLHSSKENQSFSPPHLSYSQFDDVEVRLSSLSLSLSDWTFSSFLKNSSPTPQHSVRAIQPTVKSSEVRLLLLHQKREREMWLVCLVVEW